MSEFNKAAATAAIGGTNDNNEEEEVEVLDNRVLEEREDERRKLTSPNEIIDKDNFVVRSHNDARKATQILAVAAVSFGACIYGTTMAFPAVAKHSLESSNCTVNTSGTLTEEDVAICSNNGTLDIAPLPFYINMDDLAYIASIPSFGTLFGSLFAGPISNQIGRKWTYIWGVWGTLAAGYVLIATAQGAWMMLLGRFFHGAGVGFAMTIATVYIMEIATPNLRGRLAAVPAVAGTIGLLFCQCIGAITNWKVLSITLASLCVPFLAALIFIPESPVYLITTNQIDRAHRVLRILRGPKWNVTAELTDIKNAQDDTQQDKASIKARDFFSPGVLKPFLIALGLMFFVQFTGINIIIVYTPHIFEQAGSSIDKFLATIIVGVALLMSNLLTVMVADKMPRRLMLLLSAFGISATLIGIGVFMHLNSLEDEMCKNSPVVANQLVVASDEGDDDDVIGTSSTTTITVEDCPKVYTENLGWLPLLLTMIYIFFFNLGYGAMVMITMVEILPQHVRTVAASLAGGFSCLWSFPTTHSYLYLQEMVTIQGLFWLYGAVSFLGLIFIAVFVPETKGKTEVEIQNHFVAKKTRTKAGRKASPKTPSKAMGTPPTTSVPLVSAGLSA